MAPADDDISIEEKRVYAGAAGRTDAYVATGTGVVRVALSADKVGAFDMVSRDPARDVAVHPGGGDTPDVVGVATPNGLLVSPVGDELTFGRVETGPIVAVGSHGDSFVVAGEDGRIDRVEVENADTDDWRGETAGTGEGNDPTVTRIGSVPDPTAIDGPLVAAADGVHRIAECDASASGQELVSVGLADARDVAGAGVPLAATAEGLYWLGNGWMTAVEDDAEAVAADGDGHAMAVVGGDLFVRNAATSAGGGWGADAWTESELPVDERGVALGYGPGISVVVTAAGTLCVDAGDGWRHQVVGVREVGGVALGVVE